MAGSPFEDASVLLETPRGESFKGRALDVRSEEKEVLLLAEFPTHPTPLLQLGERARLSLTGEGLKTLIRVEGSVVFRRDEDEGRSYHFSLDAETGGRVGLLVNRRAAIRVKPTAAKPVVAMVNVALDEPPVEVVLRDLSTTGVSLVIRRQLEARLFSLSKVRITLQLPDEKNPIAMIGCIRNRRLLDASLVYGIEFEKEDSTDFLMRQDQILRFVLNRYSENSRRS